MFSKNEIIKILKIYGLSPRKHLGQNFLISKNIYQKILASANLSREDRVLEVGPGLGTLTFLLAQKSGFVVAVEKDKNFIKILKNRLKSYKNVRIIQGDILNFNPGKYGFTPRKYKIVANLPYYLTSHFLRIFLEKYPPKEMVLLIQKEVAQKIISKKEKESLLSLSVKFFANPKIISFVEKESFWPQPKVGAAILKLKIKEERNKTREENFFKVLRAGFSHPRKKLINNLANELSLEKSDIEEILRESKIDRDERPENLSLEKWIKLTNLLVPLFKKL